MKMLIVEDEEILLERLVKTIEWKEIGIKTVYAAQNGDDAKRILDSDDIDIVLTDIKMPLMDGLTLTEYVCKTQKNTQVVIMSGYKEFEFAQRALRLGVKDYILKPFTKEEILDVIKKLIVEIQNNKWKIEDRYEEGYSDGTLKAVIDYINAHFSEQITLCHVANYVHLNPVYLGRLIKKRFGKSFKELLTEIRLKKAADMLKNSELKNYEIAEAVGFSDPQYFSQVFKKVFGLTPNEWRKINIGKFNMFNF